MSLLTNLIGYWSLNEASGTRADSAGTNDLADVNSVGSAAGKVGTAASLARASSQYLHHASDSDLQTGDIDFTLTAWVNLSTSGGTRQMVVAKDVDTSREFLLACGNSGTQFSFAVFASGGGADEVTATGASPSTGTWYFLTAWHDSVNNLIGLSVNAGTPVTLAHSTGVLAGSADFRVGARAYPSFNDFFDGLIDEVGFWKRVLTSQERTDLYNGGAGLAFGSFGGGGGTVSGSGSPSTGRVTDSGSGAVTDPGSGSPSTGRVTDTGSGAVTSAGSGADTLGRVTDSGSGAVTDPGTGSPSTGRVTDSGSGAVTDSGSGADTLGRVTASGSGGGAGTGSGSPSLGRVTDSGSGVVTDPGSGAATLGRVTDAGSGVVTDRGTGGDTLGRVTAAGSGSVAGGTAAWVTDLDLDFAALPDSPAPLGHGLTDATSSWSISGGKALCSADNKVAYLPVSASNGQRVAVDFGAVDYLQVMALSTGAAASGYIGLPGTNLFGAGNGGFQTVSSWLVTPLFRSLGSYRCVLQVVGPVESSWLVDSRNPNRPLGAVSTASGLAPTSGYGGMLGTTGASANRVKVERQPGAGFAASPGLVQAGAAVSLTLTGIGTAWTSGTTFTAALGSITNVVVNAGLQTATCDYTAPRAVTLDTIGDGSGFTFLVATSPRVVLLVGGVGDSITQGMNATDSNYCALTLLGANATNPDHTLLGGTVAALDPSLDLSVSNAGVAGATTADWLPGGAYDTNAVNQFAGAWPHFSGAPYERWINLMPGTNDANTGVPVPTYSANVATIAAAWVGRGFKVLLHSPVCSSNYALEQQYNAAIPALCDGTNVFLGDQAASAHFHDHPELVVGGHPNDAGHAYLSGAWAAGYAAAPAIAGTGAGTLGRATGAGSGTVTTTGSGAAAPGRVTAAGSGGVHDAGAGSPSTRRVTAAGSGSVSGEGTGEELPADLPAAVVAHYNDSAAAATAGTLYNHGAGRGAAPPYTTFEEVSATLAFASSTSKLLRTKLRFRVYCETPDAAAAAGDAVAAALAGVALRFTGGGTGAFTPGDRGHREEPGTLTDAGNPAWHYLAEFTALVRRS